ncbi:MAG TPA: hypothetical protein DIC60_05785 [Lachnospiraceae bacterium]|nr:hypothetical protein [Lachnospiraceae bacterium]
MTEAIMTGIFTLVGVVTGGFSSWIIAAYTNRKSHEERVLENQQALCTNMLINLNKMIEKLPEENADLSAFKEYLETEFYPKRNPTVLAEEMLYLTDDIRSTFMAICIFAENDFTKDCNYDIIRRKIFIHRNIFVEMLREDLKIFFENENSKKKNKRYEKFVNMQLKSIKAEQIDN